MPSQSRSRRRRLLNAPQTHVFASAADERDAVDPKPTKQEWSRMVAGTYFTTTDCRVFREHDRCVSCLSGISCMLKVCSAVLHSDDRAGNAWIAHIISIRSRLGANRPWVLVQWYYSYEDLKAEFGIAFNESVVISLGRHGGDSLMLVLQSGTRRGYPRTSECILTAKTYCRTAFSIVRSPSDAPTTPNSRLDTGVVAVPQWVENTTAFPPINRDSFFVRYSISWTQSHARRFAQPVWKVC